MVGRISIGTSKYLKTTERQSPDQKDNPSVSLSGRYRLDQRPLCWFQHHLMNVQKWFQPLTPCCRPAELGVPVHGVNVEEHGATGVGHVRAVDPSVAAPRQALGK